MHVCPMVTGLVPHVGGPVSLGCPTVLIGFMPAARLGDMCICVGPPDSIAMGAPTVLIGGQPAARLGDPTMHGGVITVGCPTVLIGAAGSGGAGAGGGGGVVTDGNTGDAATATGTDGAAANEPPDAEWKVGEIVQVGSKVGPVDDGAVKLSVGIKVQKSDDLERFGDKDNFVSLGHYDGSVGTGYDYDPAKDQHSFNVVKLEGRFATVESQAKGSAAKGLLEAEVKGEVLSVEANVTPLSIVTGKDTFLVKSEAGAEANLVKVAGAGRVNITPKTLYDNTVGTVVEFVAPGSDYAEAPEWLDHGVVVGAGGEAGIGAAAKASAEAGIEDGVAGVEAEVKVGLGPMAGLKLFVGVK